MSINVRRINRNLVVSLHQIKLVKNVGAMEADRNILEVWERVALRSSGHIEAAIIATRSPGTD